MGFKTGGLLWESAAGPVLFSIFINCVDHVGCSISNTGGV